MLALITEVVASAALGGGSRRGVGVLLSLESREPQDDRRQARCSSGLASEEGGRVTPQTNTEERLPAGLKIPGSRQQGPAAALVPSNRRICSLESLNPTFKSLNLSSCAARGAAEAGMNLIIQVL